MRNINSQQIHTFEKGMDQDLSKLLLGEGKTYEVKNMTIAGNNSNEAGALSNILGNALSYSFSISGLGTLIPIGWCTIRDDIYIFTTDNQTNNPGGVDKDLSIPADPECRGQIWKYTYDKITLVPTVTLIYDNFLNLTTKHPIANPGGIVGIYENPEIQRIYWTDNFNYLRSINVADTSVSSIDPKHLDIVSDIKFKPTILKEILSGNLPAGIYQVSYRLIRKSGEVTTFSPCSNLYPILSGNIYSSQHLYPLNEEDELPQSEQKAKEFNSEKSIRVEISNLPTGFDYIQLAYIYYKQKDTPQVFLLSEQPIPQNKTYSEIISNNEEGVTTITDAEFIALSNPFSRCKTINTKESILFAANTYSDIFDIDFDARAYRYKSDLSTYVSFPVAEDDDAINPYNDENPSTNADWLTNDQYKYQSDGTTLGGEGDNIKYSFVTETITGDTSGSTPVGLPFIEIPQIDTTYSTVSGQTYNLKSFDSLKSPFLSSLLTGYTRGEIYRFGIVFYDLKGNASFVKWIGDIRFPYHIDPSNNTEIFPISLYDGITEDITLKTLGINFEVTLTQEQKEKISGYSIVRVERKINDRTKLGTGITGGFLQQDSRPMDIGTFASTIATVIENGLKSVFYIDLPLGIGARLNEKIKEKVDDTISNIGGTLSQLQYRFDEDSYRALLKAAVASVGNLVGAVLINSPLGDKIVDFVFETTKDFIKKEVGGISQNVYCIGSYITGKSFGYIISPIISFDKYLSSPNDYIRILYAYDDLTAKLTTIYHTDRTTGIHEGTDSVAIYRKWYNGQLQSDNLKLSILKENVLQIGEILQPSFDASALSGYTVSNSYINYIHKIGNDGLLLSQDNWFHPKKVFGIGDKKHYISLSGNVYSDGGVSPAIVLGSDDQTDYDFDPLVDNGVGLENSLRPIDFNGDYLASYERYIVDQYGGNTFDKRTLNEYILCNHYVPIATDSPDTISSNVFGGDTTVAIFDAVNYAYYFFKQPGYQNPLRVKKGLAEIFPVEIPFNVNLREQRHFARNQSTDSLDEIEGLTRRKRRRQIREAKKTGNVTTTSVDLGIDDKDLPITQQRFLFDDFKFDEVLEQENNIRKFYPKPYIFIPNNVNSYRIWQSERKIYGEFLDSWRKFKFLNYLDINGTYGEITNLITLENFLYAFQDKAFGIASINERGAISTTIGEVVLGNGEVLKRFDYISNIIGSKHQFGFTQNDKAVYFFDSYSRSINKFSRSQNVADLSIITGMSSYFYNNLNSDVLTNDNPIDNRGICSTFDYCYNEAIFTFRDGINNFTISYSELNNAFNSFYSYTPFIYINDKSNIFTPNPLVSNDLNTQHAGDFCNFYGTFYPSSIKIITNFQGSSTKVFDNIEIHSESTLNNIEQLNSTINTIRCENDYQDTGIVILDPITTQNIKRKERTWQLSIPRSLDNEERLRDKTLTTTVTFNNTNNIKYLIHYIKNLFRISAR